MDIDFIVQDTYALVRPQWKIVSELSEAANLFAEACATNYEAQGQDRVSEAAEDEVESSSEDEMGEDGGPDVLDAAGSSSEEADVSNLM